MKTQLSVRQLPDLFGTPNKHHRVGRVCKNCGTVISIYNPNKVCYVCLRKGYGRKHEG